MHFLNSICMKNKYMLCINMLNDGQCRYGNICTYAHGLNDQTIEPIRKYVYNLIDNNVKLDKLDFINNMDVYNCMIKLTKMCTKCENNNCIGGYNCRSGACMKKYHICYDDLTYGNCKYINCDCVHLTRRGLVPYIDQENNASIEDFDKKALEEEILSKLFSKKYSDSEDCSESEETINEFIKYLNSE